MTTLIISMACPLIETEKWYVSNQDGEQVVLLNKRKDIFVFVSLCIVLQEVPCLSIGSD